jgi:hypothetical protein
MIFCDFYKELLVDAQSLLDESSNAYDEASHAADETARQYSEDSPERTLMEDIRAILGCQYSRIYDHVEHLKQQVAFACGEQ